MSQTPSKAIQPIDFSVLILLAFTGYQRLAIQVNFSTGKYFDQDFPTWWCQSKQTEPLQVLSVQGGDFCSTELNFKVPLMHAHACSLKI